MTVKATVLLILLLLMDRLLEAYKGMHIFKLRFADSRFISFQMSMQSTKLQPKPPLPPGAGERRRVRFADEIDAATRPSASSTSQSPSPLRPRLQLLDLLRLLDLQQGPHADAFIQALGPRPTCSLRATCREARQHREGFPGAVGAVRATLALERDGGFSVLKTLRREEEEAYESWCWLMPRLWWRQVWPEYGQGLLQYLRRCSCRTSRLTIRAEGGGAQVLRPFASAAAAAISGGGGGGGGGGHGAAAASCPRVFELKLYGTSYPPSHRNATAITGATAAVNGFYVPPDIPAITPAYATAICGLFPNLRALILRGKWAVQYDEPGAPWEDQGGFALDSIGGGGSGSLELAQQKQEGDAWLGNLCQLKHLQHLELPAVFLPGNVSTDISVLARLTRLEHLHLTLQRRADKNANDGGGPYFSPYGCLREGLPKLVQLRRLVLYGGPKRPSRELLAALPGSLELLRLEGEGEEPPLPPSWQPLEEMLAARAAAAAATSTAMEVSPLAPYHKPTIISVTSCGPSVEAAAPAGPAATKMTAGHGPMGRCHVAEVRVLSLTLDNPDRGPDGLEALVEMLRSPPPPPPPPPSLPETAPAPQVVADQLTARRTVLHLPNVHIKVNGGVLAEALRRLANTGAVRMQLLQLYESPVATSSASSSATGGGGALATVISLLKGLREDWLSMILRGEMQEDDAVLPRKLGVRLYEMAGGGYTAAKAITTASVKAQLHAVLENWPYLDQVVVHCTTPLATSARRLLAGPPASPSEASVASFGTVQCRHSWKNIQNVAGSRRSKAPGFKVLIGVMIGMKRKEPPSRSAALPNRPRG
ncbi:hypothetical protein VOLCADRAFT_92895 [Volvox carteri f. nagariensis]|uniref:Uncharacterized protein n=1 Tax=Volvox carteri f. nagariensis TaxID=3068 RepID=D8U0R4_VOLCA|nr:uncharacterized protein VOLCADRAFT_92895 [Volvox carteri f. nagariensis]EFJ46761.1 hypothetical protein VOLCADRAFT_92895 [Volvox carteri f. nagariensis]|eukprot:XP_002952290.1 hypothetical protein VOLCADRAFT_92895 [Volvox carteri f. nagariensis]